MSDAENEMNPTEALQTLLDADAPLRLAEKPQRSSDDLLPAPAPRTLPVSFTGKASEFFSIWITNTFLSVITLGFYSPWAKIRTKRYFYGHTSIDGHTFDYLADPIAILKGRLLVMFVLGLVYGGALIHPLITLVGWLLALVFTPWAMARSLSFNMRNTTYRGVRFGFTGQVGEITKTFWYSVLMQVITFGFYAPFFALNMINFKLSNTRYGDEPFRFNKAPGFYGIYVGSFFLMMMGLIVSVAIPLILKVPQDLAPLVINVVFYPTIAIFAALLQGGIFNYVAQNLTLNGARFSSTLSRGSLAWLYFTNLFAVIFSFGLALPWVITRIYSYKASCFTVHIDDPGLLGRVGSVAQDHGSAAGDAAVEVMDIEIGI